MSAERFLPYGRQSIDADDIAAVVDVLQSDYLATGPQAAGFENDLARATGADHAVVCANGTAALHLVSMALGLGPGDVVIVPTLTFLATANAPAFTGARVVFADVDPQTGRMTPQTLEAALARAGAPVKAVFNVHLAGPVEDCAALGMLAETHGFALIEDACHALGTSYRDQGRWRRVGDCAYARATCFSFHPVKTVAMGEGGAVTTNDPALAEQLARLRNHGVVRDPAQFTDEEAAFAPDGAPNPWYYEMPAPGLNYRASDIHCALGRSQLAKLARFVARRARLARAYDARLAERLPEVGRPIAAPHIRAGWHLYAVRVDFEALGLTRADVMRALAAKGVGTQVHYRPVHLQPHYRARAPEPALPGADAYYAKTLSLPLFPAMTMADVERVVDALADVLRAPVRLKRAS